MQYASPCVACKQYGCQMSPDLKIGSELAYLKQIMLIHTEMDVMMIFMAAEKTTKCILLVCEFFSEKLPL